MDINESNFYEFDDFSSLQNKQPQSNPSMQLLSVDQLLSRDEQREKDGFPRKVRFGKFMKPGHGKKKIIVVPTVEEEKFIHDNSFEEEFEQGGSTPGEEGDVIGEQPIEQQQDGNGTGSGGDGGDTNHEIESNAYELGKILTEKFQLPNLKDKGKKQSLTKYTYDMTDKNKFGQLLDKKATLKKIIKTNIGLGRLDPTKEINTDNLLIAPRDKVYRTLSREKSYESQAMVFFLRDYSGSMTGDVTNLVVSQHVMIYSWLIYQYASRVETRFILHDTKAKEVPDFSTYYNSRVAGGTYVSSAYELVNKIIEEEGLERDYNIYVFHGTDGDDWDSKGEKTIPQLEKMVQYTSRTGLSIIRHAYGEGHKTEMENYINSDFMKKYRKEFRMDAMNEGASETRLIEGIKTLLED